MTAARRPPWYNTVPDPDMLVRGLSPRYMIGSTAIYPEEMDIWHTTWSRHSEVEACAHVEQELLVDISAWMHQLTFLGRVAYWSMRPAQAALHAGPFPMIPKGAAGATPYTALSRISVVLIKVDGALLCDSRAVMTALGLQPSGGFPVGKSIQPPTRGAKK